MAEKISAVKEIRQQGDAVIVCLRGDIDLHQAPEVHEVLTTVNEKHPKRVVINCEEVTYIDSSGIGTLVEVFRSMRSFGGTLVLCCVNERVYNVLEITRLNNIFELYDTETEAAME